LTDLKSSIARCAHGVYDARQDGGPNTECSVCTPIKILDRVMPKTLLIRLDGMWQNLAKK
jgi:hypothetical protein